MAQKNVLKFFNFAKKELVISGNVTYRPPNVGCNKCFTDT